MDVAHRRKLEESACYADGITSYEERRARSLSPPVQEEPRPLIASFADAPELLESRSPIQTYKQRQRQISTSYEEALALETAAIDQKANADAVAEAQREREALAVKEQYEAAPRASEEESRLASRRSLIQRINQRPKADTEGDSDDESPTKLLGDCIALLDDALGEPPGSKPAESCESSTSGTSGPAEASSSQQAPEEEEEELPPTDFFADVLGRREDTLTLTPRRESGPSVSPSDRDGRPTVSLSERLARRRQNLAEKDRADETLGQRTNLIQRITDQAQALDLDGRAKEKAKEGGSSSSKSKESAAEEAIAHAEEALAAMSQEQGGVNGEEMGQLASQLKTMVGGGTAMTGAQ